MPRAFVYASFSVHRSKNRSVCCAGGRESRWSDSADEKNARAIARCDAGRSVASTSIPMRSQKDTAHATNPSVWDKLK